MPENTTSKKKAVAKVAEQPKPEPKVQPKSEPKVAEQPKPFRPEPKSPGDRVVARFLQRRNEA